MPPSKSRRSRSAAAPRRSASTDISPTATPSTRPSPTSGFSTSSIAKGRTPGSRGSATSSTPPTRRRRPPSSRTCSRPIPTCPASSRTTTGSSSSRPRPTGAPAPSSTASPRSPSWTSRRPRSWSRSWPSASPSASGTRPIGGALMRNADSPTTVADVETDLVTHFNPDGEPERDPPGGRRDGRLGNTYPTFLDPLVVRTPGRPPALDAADGGPLPLLPPESGPDLRQEPRRHGPRRPARQPLADLRGRLPAGRPDRPTRASRSTSPTTRRPARPGPRSSTTCSSRTASAWRSGSRPTPTATPPPRSTSSAARTARPATYKDLYLQAYGSALDPAQTNLAEARLARDMSGVANAYTVESGLVRYEASFILAPGFPISAADATDGTALRGLRPERPRFPEQPRQVSALRLRRDGRGALGLRRGRPCPRPSPRSDDAAGRPERRRRRLRPYVKRRRVPLGELFTLDPNQKPLRAQLSISTDYAGPQPGLWDGTGTWQAVDGGFELLKDRLGIWINVREPQRLEHRGIQGVRVPRIRRASSRASRTRRRPDRRRFHLRLTCVIEGDRPLSATADRRPSIPTQYTGHPAGRRPRPLRQAYHGGRRASSTPRPRRSSSGTTAPKPSPRRTPDASRARRARSPAR